MLNIDLISGIRSIWSRSQERHVKCGVVPSAAVLDMELVPGAVVLNVKMFTSKSC